MKAYDFVPVVIHPLYLLFFFFVFVLEEAQVSYWRMEDNLKQENVLHLQKIEEIEAANHRELAARDTKHSRELAECECWSHS
jgi:hypothetical protein